MTSYAVAHLRDVVMSPALIEYVQAIDGTLAPFEGHFIIHGGEKIVLEGHVADDLIVIAFPDRQSALGWYDSPAYRAILDKRKGSSKGEVFIIDGVEDGHRAIDILHP
ncbi:uncharacterized protein (DUF1330 family) [Rhodoligotrophos appendicifer]|uniref:DUF1330 domain-containing protein n=1 Tax=Rhodoligotrophos appendicifer TaxID=987056 RepID=UPI001185F966|nr:DUF1330 domain-containing protein [Rhodoligotrophos appendicifer]